MKMILRIDFLMFAESHDFFDVMTTCMKKSGIADLHQSSQGGCQNCGSVDVYIEGHDEICGSCGANMGASIDYRPEWRHDASIGDMSRCNLARNEILPESSYSTGMSMTSRSSKVHYELQRTMIWSSVPYPERSRKIRMDNIEMVCRANDIPEAIYACAQNRYYRIICALEEAGLKRRRGNNDMGLQGAGLFIALQQDGKPRTYKEIAGMFCIEPKYVSEGIKLYERLLSSNKVTLYSDYIDEFCGSLNIPDSLRGRVEYVADKAEQLGILENNAPTSIVAGCIYYVSVEHALNIRVQDIAEQCKVSVPTINKVCSKLFRRSMELMEEI